MSPREIINWRTSPPSQRFPLVLVLLRFLSCLLFPYAPIHSRRRVWLSPTVLAAHIFKLGIKGDNLNKDFHLEKSFQCVFQSYSEQGIGKELIDKVIYKTVKGTKL